jgi:hypothetical protein
MGENKGEIKITYNHPKQCYEIERFSTFPTCCITVRAYLDAHDMKTFVGIAEDNHYHSVLKFGFKDILSAFVWADNQVSYYKGTIKKQK